MQGLVSVEEGERGETGVGGAGANLGRNGEGAGSIGRGRGGMVGGRIERDIRDEDEYLYDESRVQGRSDGLFAALEEADKRHQQAKTVRGTVQEELARCPVCGEFEGDERTVAFHVEEHFAA